MNQSAVLELRLHSGAHAGAHETLQAETYLLGSGSDCDFVLGDADILVRQARLERGPEGWQLRCWEEDDIATINVKDLTPGTLYAAGPLVLSIAQIQAPWPSTEELNALLKAPTIETLPVQGALNTAEAEPVDTIPELGIRPRPSKEPIASATAHGNTDLASTQGSAKRLSARRSSPILLGALVSVIAGGLMWVLWPDFSKSNEAVAAQSTTPNSGLGRKDVNQVIQTLGLEAKVVVVDGPAGLPLVSAALLSEAEYESLAMALSQLAPRPGLTVTTEQDLIDTLRDLLALQALELKTVLGSKHLGEGNFQIEGNMETANARSALLSYLQSTLPAVVTLKSALTIPEDLGQGMLAELQEAGLVNVSGIWTEGRLRLTIRLTDGQVPLWEQLLAKVSRKYSVPFTATLNLTTGSLLPVALATLPFRLKAVVSGETPYVVLSGGDKILLQGRAQGWRLMSVNPDSVVFENSAAARVVVRR